MEQSEEIEDFFGVYLLCSKSENPKFREKNYIGFTVNPNRRIKQHNRGNAHGGAKRTSNRGPWLMVMIVHGFPNSISALRFEWAWQNPKESRRLKHIEELKRKQSRESNFNYNFRILSEMLRMGPWNRLPLTVRWLAHDFVRDFPVGKTPPIHMQICHGRVVSKKRSNLLSQTQFTQITVNYCSICYGSITGTPNSVLSCLNPKCKLRCHIICLANMFLEPGQFVPVEGDCPVCRKHVLWGDLIRKRNGCCDIQTNGDEDGDSDGEIILSDLDEDD